MCDVLQWVRVSVSSEFRLKMTVRTPPHTHTHRFIHAFFLTSTNGQFSVLFKDFLFFLAYIPFECEHYSYVFCCITFALHDYIFIYRERDREAKENYILKMKWKNEEWKIDYMDFITQTKIILFVYQSIYVMGPLNLGIHWPINKY